MRSARILSVTVTAGACLLTLAGWSKPTSQSPACCSVQNLPDDLRNDSRLSGLWVLESLGASQTIYRTVVVPICVVSTIPGHAAETSTSTDPRPHPGIARWRPGTTACMNSADLSVCPTIPSRPSREPCCVLRVSPSRARRCEASNASALGTLSVAAPLGMRSDDRAGEYRLVPGNDRRDAAERRRDSSESRMHS
jgi:hypothetical protein